MVFRESRFFGETPRHHKSIQPEIPSEEVRFGKSVDVLNEAGSTKMYGWAFMGNFYDGSQFLRIPKIAATWFLNSLSNAFCCKFAAI